MSTKKTTPKNANSPVTAILEILTSLPPEDQNDVLNEVLLDIKTMRSDAYAIAKASSDRHAQTGEHFAKIIQSIFQ